MLDIVLFGAMIVAVVVSLDGILHQSVADIFHAQFLCQEIYWNEDWVVNFFLRQEVRPGSIFEVLAFDEEGMKDFEGFGIVIWERNEVVSNFGDVSRGEAGAKERRGVDKKILREVEGVLMRRCADGDGDQILALTVVCHIDGIDGADAGEEQFNGCAEC